MSKHTVRLYDFLRHKYTINRNKFYNIDSLIRQTALNDDFMNQAVTHGEAFNMTVDVELFYGVKKLLTPTTYQKFRNDFMDRFLTRPIKYQTIDLFVLHLNAEVTLISGMLEKIYSEDGYKELLNGTEKSSTVSEGTSTNTNIGTSTSLPQTSNDFASIDYADNLDKNQGDSKDSGKTESVTIKATPATLEDLQRYHANIFKTLDIKLFSQVF